MLQPPSVPQQQSAPLDLPSVLRIDPDSTNSLKIVSTYVGPEWRSASLRNAVQLGRNARDEAVIASSARRFASCK